MKLWKNLALLISMSLVLLTCVRDPNREDRKEKPPPPPPNMAELILGQWELTEGYRNGKPTQLLEGTFFVFSPEGKMLTNLGGSNEEVDYELNDRTISQNSRRFPVDYTVQAITDSTLTLSMTLRDIPFVFFLHKTEPNQHN